MTSKPIIYASPSIYPDLEFENYPSFFPKTRKEAKAKGFKHYFTNKPCKNNHIALRKEDFGSCLACGQIRAKAKRADPIKGKIIRKQRKKRYDKNRDQILKNQRDRYENDSDYRENIAFGKLRKYRMPSGERMQKEHYFQMLEKQGGKCAVCGSEDNRTSRAKYFFVDHDHETNVVRSLLCHNCNFMIGFFNDDKRIIKKAIQYLKSHSS
ncbi:endonuclease VII domain-containing protein [Gammaproteobacteria bacterium]|nr:endonuclease VII domain-containing protein [Gammaproteobacteria bacterium]